MKVETVNVIEILDNEILQVIAFTGNNAEEEAKAIFHRLILEHNDPNNEPPQNVLGFDDNEMDMMWVDGKYDDDNGYVLSVVHSACLNKQDLKNQENLFCSDERGD